MRNRHLLHKVAIRSYMYAVDHLEILRSSIGSHVALDLESQIRKIQKLGYQN